MDVAEIMSELESMGSAQTRKIYRNHCGTPDTLFGVKVGDMKKIVKKVKKDQMLAEELFATANGDAMCLAGMIADPQAITAKELRRWAKSANWSMAINYVAGVAAESPHGWKLGLEWIDATKPHVASAGWTTLAGVVAFRADEDLDLKMTKSLLARIRKSIHDAPNQVRYTMNAFVISVGCYVTPVNEKAREVAEAVGKVEVDMGSTSCKVPFAPDYIDKVVKAGRLGKKRKNVRC